MLKTSVDQQSMTLGGLPVGELSDEDLLLRYRQQQDREAFAHLVERYERELYTYLRRFLGDAALAEDAFQATFLQVHLKCDQFEEGRRVRPWLYTIATNQAIDAQRRNRRHRNLSLDRPLASEDDQSATSLADMLVSPEPSPQFNLEGSQARDWIRQALARLPEPLSGVVHLVYYQGMKYREAAEVLGIPVGTVKSRLHAAVYKLSQAWEHDHPAVNDN
jgi:RNA polymerase sigma-70 factor (ECF subfamily)